MRRRRSGHMPPRAETRRSPARRLAGLRARSEAGLPLLAGSTPGEVPEQSAAQQCHRSVWRARPRRAAVEAPLAAVSALGPERPSAVSRGTPERTRSRGTALGSTGCAERPLPTRISGNQTWRSRMKRALAEIPGTSPFAVVPGSIGTGTPFLPNQVDRAPARPDTTSVPLSRQE